MSNFNLFDFIAIILQILGAQIYGQLFFKYPIAKREALFGLIYALAFASLHQFFTLPVPLDALLFSLTTVPLHYRERIISCLWAGLILYAMMIVFQCVVLPCFPSSFLAQHYDLAGLLVNIPVTLIYITLFVLFRKFHIYLNYDSLKLYEKISSSMIALFIVVFCIYQRPRLEETYHLNTSLVLIVLSVTAIFVLLIERNATVLKSRSIISELNSQIEIMQEREHDYAKNLLILSQSADNSEGITAAKDLSAELDNYHQYNMLQPIVRNILLSYHSAFENNHIRFSLKASDIMPDLNIKKQDYISIFGNLIENAIEATIALPEEKRWIEMETEKTETCYIIRLSNPCASTAPLKDYKLGSSSKGSGHGYGIHIIQKRLNKYNAEVRFYYADDIFTAQIDFLII